MVLFPVSVTYRFPALSIAIPRGQRKRALAPTPSALPIDPTSPATTGETHETAGGTGTEDVATDGLIGSGGAVTTTGDAGCLTGAGEDPGHASRDTTATRMIAAGIQTAAGDFPNRPAQPARDLVAFATRY